MFMSCNVLRASSICCRWLFQQLQSEGLSFTLLYFQNILCKDQFMVIQYVQNLIALCLIWWWLIWKQYVLSKWSNCIWESLLPVLNSSHFRIEVIESSAKIFLSFNPLFSIATYRLWLRILQTALLFCRRLVPLLQTCMKHVQHFPAKHSHY